jgi:hypothetical protein
VERSPKKRVPIIPVVFAIITNEAIHKIKPTIQIKKLDPKIIMKSTFFIVSILVLPGND